MFDSSLLRIIDIKRIMKLQWMGWSIEKRRFVTYFFYMLHLRGVGGHLKCGLDRLGLPLGIVRGLLRHLVP